MIDFAENTVVRLRYSFSSGPEWNTKWGYQYSNLLNASAIDHWVLWRYGTLEHL